MASFERYDLHEQRHESFEQLRDNFEWYLPESFNGAQFLCDRWIADSEGDRPALVFEDHTADEQGTITFFKLEALTNQLANYFESRGVSAGDRIAVNVPQKRETLLSHMAAWKLGAVSVPLSTQYGTDALEYRIGDCDPVLGVVDATNVDDYRESVDAASDLDHTLIVGDARPRDDEEDFWDAVSSCSSTFDVEETDITDPMLLMYSSGTTGPPKGILQSHRSVVGHLPGVITNFYNCDVNADDVFWTPSEWAWGASFSVMFAAFAFGRPLVAHETNESFDPAAGFDLIERHSVTAPFLPPSALRMMMQVANPSDWDLSSVRLVSSGGESLGAETRKWATETFGSQVHEVYGLTETFNLIIGDCTAYVPSKPGWIGVPLPGHEVRILDTETHDPVDTTEVGEIAVHRSDPTMFTEYWNLPEKTAAKFSGEWMLTGDLGKMYDSGRVKFLGRKDDLIISAGYRIGPEEVEDALLTHDAVADAGVVGIPHDVRGKVPKAYVVLEDEFTAVESVASEVQTNVRENLAAYEYPREIEFVDKLPRTTTGKIRRTELRDRDTST